MNAAGDVNRCRFRPGSAAGHYESYFLRANHPQRPLAFWIRYTFFSPLRRPQDAVGEVWAIYFDGEHQRVAAAKHCVPVNECGVGDGVMALAIGPSRLDGERSSGCAGQIRWQLAYTHAQPPLLLLPQSYYSRALPRAKALVAAPAAVFTGQLQVEQQTLTIEKWRGSQNHNWGSRHTDTYAWGQVAGFDDAPDVFLECTTARLKLGPVWTPPLTLVVLRIGAREYALNSLCQAVRTRAQLDYFRWQIDAKSNDARITVNIQAPRSSFVGLAYANPPGGTKTCLNSKLASCELTIEPRDGPAKTYRTRHRAAFEILTDRHDHGVAVVV